MDLDDLRRPWSEPEADLSDSYILLAVIGNSSDPQISFADAELIRQGIDLRVTGRKANDALAQKFPDFLCGESRDDFIGSILIDLIRNRTRPPAVSIIDGRRHRASDLKP